MKVHSDNLAGFCRADVRAEVQVYILRPRERGGTRHRFTIDALWVLSSQAFLEAKVSRRRALVSKIIARSLGADSSTDIEAFEADLLAHIECRLSSCVRWSQWAEERAADRIGMLKKIWHACCEDVIRPGFLTIAAYQSMVGVRNLPLSFTGSFWPCFVAAPELALFLEVLPVALRVRSEGPVQQALPL